MPRGEVGIGKSNPYCCDEKNDAHNSDSDERTVCNNESRCFLEEKRLRGEGTSTGVKVEGGEGRGEETREET